MIPGTTSRQHLEESRGAVGVAYLKEVERPQVVAKKADFTQRQLLFVVNELRRLLADEHFRTLLRAEGIISMPTPIAERLGEQGRCPMDAAVRIASSAAWRSCRWRHFFHLRGVQDAVKASVKYRRIARSIAEVALIEPLVVARAADQPGCYLLPDGHLRHAILADQGVPNARCLMADDDGTFTYNKRINRLATIQEHYMIVRAIERGAPEDKLARALDVDVAAIRRRRTMLSGIAPEVVDMLKDKSINPSTLDVLRKMRPMRQIEAAEVMAAAGNHTASYVKALLAATKQSDLVKSDQPKRVSGLTAEQMLRMERR